MHIQTVQIVAGLVSAIAFMAAGAASLSSVFPIIGASALAWLVYGVAKRALTHRPAGDATTV